MDGFKKFILKGNLVDVAVGLIMALAFTAVVTAFTAWLTSLLPSSLDNVFSNSTHFGSFMNALISFPKIASNRCRRTHSGSSGWGSSGWSSSDGTPSD